MSKDGSKSSHKLEIRLLRVQCWKVKQQKRMLCCNGRLRIYVLARLHLSLTFTFFVSWIWQIHHSAIRAQSSAVKPTLQTHMSLSSVTYNRTIGSMGILPRNTVMASTVNNQWTNPESELHAFDRKTWHGLATYSQMQYVLLIFSM